MSVSDIDVREILALLSAVGGDPRIVGGWGVDALVERRTREHRDLDLLVPATSLEACQDALLAGGYRVGVDDLPVRIELDDGMRVVDLHPWHRLPDGSGWQAAPAGARYEYPADAWTSGLIGGLSVTCASVALQRAAHSGYPLREQDRHDLRLLEEMTGNDGGTDG